MMTQFISSISTAVTDLKQAIKDQIKNAEKAKLTAEKEAEDAEKTKLAGLNPIQRVEFLRAKSKAKFSLDFKDHSNVTVYKSHAELAAATSGDVLAIFGEPWAVKPSDELLGLVSGEGKLKNTMAKWSAKCWNAPEMKTEHRVQAPFTEAMGALDLSALWSSVLPATHLVNTNKSKSIGAILSKQFLYA